MNKKLHIFKQTLVAGLTMAVGLLFSTANAQLSGSYTINSGLPSLLTNYMTWADFSTDINTNGVSGPVTVTVITDATVSSTVTLNTITGSSATNTVTIDGASKLLSYAGTSSNRSVIDLNGPDYLTIKNLTIRNTGTYTGVRGVWFHNGADYNTLSKNTIEFSGITSGTTSSSSGGAYVAFSNTEANLYSAGDHGSYNKIDGNTMTTTNGNEEGPYTGIYIMSSTTSTSGTNTIDQNEITNNSIENFYYYGIYVRNTNGTKIDGNDISRDAVSSGNAYSTLYGIYSYYNKSDGRALTIENNSIHDLPFAGATSGTTTSYGIYSYWDNYYGTTTGTSELSGNTIENLAATSRVYPIYADYTKNQNIDNNIVKGTYQTSGYFYAIYANRCYGNSISGNDLEGITTTTGNYFYGIYCYYPNTNGDLTIEDNYVHDFVNTTTNTFGYNYGIYVYFGSASKTIIQRNHIEKIDRPGYYYAYGIYCYYQRNSIIQSNLVEDIAGYFGSYGIYAYSFNSGNHAELRQNTVRMDGSRSRQRGTAYALYHYVYYDQAIVIDANITDMKNWGTCYQVYNYNSTGGPTNYKSINYNMYSTNNNGSDRWYNREAGNTTDFATWYNDATTGSDEVYMDPLLDANSFPGVFEAQNIYPSDASNVKDVYQKNRNMVTSDRGAVYTELDLSAATTAVLPSIVCSGFELPITLDITNNFGYAASNIKVGYAINGKVVNEVATDSIASTATSTYTFATDAKFNEVGLNTLQIFLSIPDDKTSNDTITMTTTVNPAPGGSVMTASATTTNTIYQLARPDITQINTHSIYDFTAPRAYTNAGYGSSLDWTADAWIETSTGFILPAADVVLTAPAGGTDMIVDFMTTDAAYEDEMLTLKVKFTDIGNGCDTTYKNQIFVYPTITPDFTFPARICDQGVVLFENTSTVKSGGMEMNWDFGTGNPADKTQAPEPVFQFPSAGTYTVTLVASTLPWGFEQTKDYVITVNEIPTVNFTKLNACEGDDLTFTSNVTPVSSILSWDFGDGTTSAMTNPTKQYTSTGSYNVTLSANLNGCVSSATQIAYQFDKPVAAAVVASGNCDNEEIVITNNSTITSGNFGSIWDLDDAGAVSTQKDAKHMYSTPGNKNVKLTVTTDFGCKDEITVPVTVKESPKVAFTNTPACSIDPTMFSNLTPAVTGTSPTFAWDFSDGTSGAENPSHPWTSLGTKLVKFNVSLDNGCSAEVTKELSVGVQPVVNFEAANVCAGAPVVFDNQTTWPSGDISYAWDFADLNTSTESDPVHNYNTNATKTYVVTLKASIAGGCEAESQKQITVNEGPKTCDFNFANDYTVGLTAIKLTPTGGSSAGIDYTWILGNEGSKTSSDGGLTYKWQNQGPQTVSMRAKVRTTGCECASTKTIVSSSVTANNQLSAIVFPNPSTGGLFVKMNKAQGQEVSMNLMSMTGAVVKSHTTVNNGTMSFDASNVSNGVYLLKMVSGEEVSTVKVTIQH